MSQRNGILRRESRRVAGVTVRFLFRSRNRLFSTPTLAAHTWPTLRPSAAIQIASEAQRGPKHGKNAHKSAQFSPPPAPCPSWPPHTAQHHATHTTHHSSPHPPMRHHHAAASNRPSWPICLPGPMVLACPCHRAGRAHHPAPAARAAPLRRRALAFG